MSRLDGKQPGSCHTGWPSGESAGRHPGGHRGLRLGARLGALPMRSPRRERKLLAAMERTGEHGLQLGAYFLHQTRGFCARPSIAIWTSRTRSRAVMHQSALCLSDPSPGRERNRVPRSTYNRRRTDARKMPPVFVELDARHNDGFTVSLEWNRDTGQTQIVIDDTPNATQTVFRVPGVNAADAFRHPFRYAR